jgi:hypothetical protein
MTGQKIMSEASVRQEQNLFRRPERADGRVPCENSQHLNAEFEKDLKEFRPQNKRFNFRRAFKVTNIAETGSWTTGSEFIRLSR